MQFYPQDWQSDPKLRRCSHAEKGILVDVLCILHDQDEYGVVRWSLRDLATAVHCRISALQSLVAKRVLKGCDDRDSKCEPVLYVPRHARQDGEPVTLLAEQNGPIWYSSRMVRDEYTRKQAGAATRFVKAEAVHPPAGRVKAGRSPSHRQGDGPSSSSSSSSLPLLDLESKNNLECVDGHAAVNHYQKICGRAPNEAQREEIVKTVGDPELYRKVLVQFMLESRPPERVDWTLERYREQAIAAHAAERPFQPELNNWESLTPDEQERQIRNDLGYQGPGRKDDVRAGKEKGNGELVLVKLVKKAG